MEHFTSLGPYPGQPSKECIVFVKCPYVIADLLDYMNVRLFFGLPDEVYLGPPGFLNRNREKFIKLYLALRHLHNMHTTNDLRCIFVHAYYTSVPASGAVTNAPDGGTELITDSNPMQSVADSDDPVSASHLMLRVYREYLGGQMEEVTPIVREQMLQLRFI